MKWKSIIDSGLKLVAAFVDVDGYIKEVGDKIEKRVVELIDEVRERIISSLLEIFCYSVFLTLFILALVDFGSQYLPYYTLYAIMGLIALAFGLLISRARERERYRKCPPYR